MEEAQGMLDNAKCFTANSSKWLADEASYLKLATHNEHNSCKQVN